MLPMSSPDVQNTCPYCAESMKTTRMACEACGIAVEATFADRPLARLPVEHQRFIEMFVLAGGSLKEIAKQAGVSYPTVRNRLDKVIEHLRVQVLAEAPKERGRKMDEPSAADILKQI